MTETAKTYLEPEQYSKLKSAVEFDDEFSSVSEVLREKAIDYAAEVGSLSPEALEERADELDNEVSSLESEVASLEEDIESKTQKAASLRERADELDEARGTYDEEVAEVVEWMEENPSARVFPEHKMIQKVSAKFGNPVEEILSDIADREQIESGRVETEVDN
jgi:chromosome segregation ATPase